MNKIKYKIDNPAKGHRRAPMTVNEQGEVIFAPIQHEAQGEAGRRKICNPLSHKPTPLMLCNEITKMFGSVMRESTEKECPLTGSYRDIIFHLAREDGKTQLELANLIHITPPSASVALVKLEEDGYIKREADECDKRKVRVYLTEKGKKIDERSRSVIKTLDAKATEGFSEEEIKNLCVLLYRMRENIAND
ncbi:MAG: winged helix-turn-helix transcriptional regulator [Clostridia bacterium]|nr:winged helix-turn-helix transcriptional regulator [Clostridia bacterium]